MCPHGGRARTCSQNGFLGAARPPMTVTLVTAAEKIVKLKMARIMGMAAVCGRLQWLNPRSGVWVVGLACLASSLAWASIVAEPSCCNPKVALILTDR